MIESCFCFCIVSFSSLIWFLKKQKEQFIFQKVSRCSAFFCDPRMPKSAESIVFFWDVGIHFSPKGHLLIYNRGLSQNIVFLRGHLLKFRKCWLHGHISTTNFIFILQHHWFTPHVKVSINSILLDEVFSKTIIIFFRADPENLKNATKV